MWSIFLCVLTKGFSPEGFPLFCSALSDFGVRVNMALKTHVGKCSLLFSGSFCKIGTISQEFERIHHWNHLGLELTMNFFCRYETNKIFFHLVPVGFLFCPFHWRCQIFVIMVVVIFSFYLFNACIPCVVIPTSTLLLFFFRLRYN